MAEVVVAQRRVCWPGLGGCRLSPGPPCLVVGEAQINELLATILGATMDMDDVSSRG